MSQNDAYRELFEHSADCILIIEGERFVDCNTAACEMFGASDRSEMLNTHPSDISPEFQPDGQPSFEKANEMIEEFCRRNDQLHFIDVFTPMLDEDGQPRGELFIGDQLHMNAAGYELWTEIVRKAMQFPRPLLVID